MQEDTPQVVEENNLSVPTEETTITEQTSEAEVEQPEQAEETEVSQEPSESPTEVEEQREVKRQPRVERRFDQLTKKLAESGRQAQPTPAQFLPQVEMPKIEPGMEYDAEQLDAVLTQKAMAISQANNAQLVAALNTQQTVGSYINNVTEDMAHLRSKYDVLNPDSPNYDPQLEEDISDTYDRENPIEVNGQYNQRVDTNYRLKDAAEKYLRNVERYRTKGQVESKQDLQAAADSAVIPPSGGMQTSSNDDSPEALREKLANFKF